MTARKAGGKTRTHAQMMELGAVLVGTFSRHKFVKMNVSSRLRPLPPPDTHLPQQCNTQTEARTLAKITMEITPHHGASVEDVQNWIGDGLALETKTKLLGSTSLSPASLPLDNLDGDSSHQADDSQSGEAGTDDGPSVDTSAKRRGRKTNAEKAAEREAAERVAAELRQQPASAAPAAAAPPPPPPVLVASNPSPTGGAALPPGITIGGTVAAAPPVQLAPAPAAAPTPSPAPAPVAMPPAQPAVVAPSGIMPLDQYREASRQMHMVRPGIVMRVMKAEVWPSDKTPKTVYFTAEATPEADRERVIAEVENLMQSES